MGSERSNPGDIRNALARDGYVVIPSAFDPSQVATLLDACENAVSLARLGKWPHLRTIPIQFPPWPVDSSKGIWGVQHLMHPSMPSSQIFAASYFNDKIIQTVMTLLNDCDEDDLVMELYNLLTRPDEDFALRWHRDDIDAEASARKELERLSKPSWHAQWNLALCPDKSLTVIPGSHLRARSEQERGMDPYDNDVPGQLIVNLLPGDMVFYNNNILHRGVYSSQTPRMTLHGSIGHVEGSTERARNVLQHGVSEWVEQCDFSTLPANMRSRAEGMRSRLVEMGTRNPNVGYTHQDYIS